MYTPKRNLHPKLPETGTPTVYTLPSLCSTHFEVGNSEALLQSALTTQYLCTASEPETRSG